jgi:hypothetical protein
MPLILEPLTFAIICGFELETYDAKQELQDGPNAIRAYVASKAGKVIVSWNLLVNTKGLTIMTSNSVSRLATSCPTLTFLSIFISMGSTYPSIVYELGSGVSYRESQRQALQSYHSNFMIYNSSVHSLLKHPLRRTFLIPSEDPDVENSFVVPEMGTIELRAYRCREKYIVPYFPDATNVLHQGRVSERSKKAGWHQVR